MLNQIKNLFSSLGAGSRSAPSVDYQQLRNKVVVITGASKGLGFLLAREFARENCCVVICARHADELEEAKRNLLLENRQAEILTVVCDIQERSQAEELIEKATAHFGRIDILVNNAGTIGVGPLEALSVENFEEVIQTNFWGMAYPTLAVIPQMQARQSGQIVNITSLGGKISVPHLLPYSVSKFAAVGFSEGLYTELAKDNVQVTTIVPGLMRTGSFLNAEFKGDKPSEFNWFSLGASLPLISMDAERAARRILQATKRQEVECILSVPASIGVKLYGLAPAFTLKLLKLTKELLLPKASHQRGVETGREIRLKYFNPVLEALTILGRSAAHRFNQTPPNLKPPKKTLS